MPDGPWIWIDFAGSSESLELLQAELGATGASGSQVLEGGVLRVWWPENREPAELRRIALSAASLSGAELRGTGLQEEEDWLAEWRRHRRPLRASRRFLLVPPEHLDAPGARAPRGVHRIVLDQRMAFGSGTHATTRLCLGMLEEILRPGWDVLDVGSGTGVLAIAAAILGARSVTAVEADEDVLAELRANLTANEVEHRVEVVGRDFADVSVEGPRLVVANLILARLVPLLAALARAAQDLPVIISGIEEEQERELHEALEGAGLAAGEVRRLEGWIGCAARRPSPSQGE